jgi:hypothetical protein
MVCVCDLRRSLEGYLSECINEIVDISRLDSAIELHEKLLKCGYYA